MNVKPHKSIKSIVGILLFLAIPGLPLSRWENEFAGVGHLIGYEAIWWSIVILLLLYVRKLEVRPLSSIGFRVPRLSDMLIGIGVAFITLAGFAWIFYVIFPALHLSESHQVNQLLATPLWWRLASVVRAAVGEEVVFRGYAIERSQEITNSMTAACILPWFVFTIEHVGMWGWSHMIVAGFGGATLTALYSGRRNLWSNILAHLIVDGASLLAG
jgi:membrane protease YdiL (CAAX protease family)